MTTSRSTGHRSVPRVRVFEAVPKPGATVRYTDSFVRHAPDDVDYSFFSWPRALWGRYDVLHVHWPEFLVRDDIPRRALVRRAYFLLLILRLWLTRTPVVRTLHNVQPHQAGPRGERRLLAMLDARVRCYVALNDCTPLPRGGVHSTVIPHGDYVEPLRASPRRERSRGRVLLLGRIERYKGVLDLVAAAGSIDQGDVEIRIVGAARPDIEAEIRDALAARRPGSAPVTLDLRSVSDDEMVAEITSADLIALPYRDAGNGNSGVAMVALSLNRPVLVYRSCMMERLADEVGAEWVHMMDAPISGPAIGEALERVARLPECAEPTLSGRDWKSLADAYARVFRDVVSPIRRGSLR